MSTNLDFPQAVEDQLLLQSFDFETREIPYALQFRFADGAILNVFVTGKVSWQGSITDTRQAVDPIIHAIRSRAFPGGASLRRRPLPLAAGLIERPAAHPQSGSKALNGSLGQNSAGLRLGGTERLLIPRFDSPED